MGNSVEKVLIFSKSALIKKLLSTKIKKYTYNQTIK